MKNETIIEKFKISSQGQTYYQILKLYLAITQMINCIFHDIAFYINERKCVYFFPNTFNYFIKSILCIKRCALVPNGKVYVNNVWWKRYYFFTISDENEYDFPMRRFRSTPSDPLKISSRRDYSCSFCCKHFKTKQSLNTHQNFACQSRHEKKHVCYWCKKKYLTKHQLTLHDKTCYCRKRRQEQ